MERDGEFRGRVVLITGGARNIGRAMAEMFAGAGARVAVNTAASRDDLAATTACIEAQGGEAMGCLADVTDPDAVREMVDAVTARWGRLDILVNNAVTHMVAPIAEFEFEDWRRTHAVVLDGAFHCVQAALPALVRAGGGSVVNMGGAFGHWPAAGRAATAAAKAGLAGFTRTLALELAPHRINVNYVAPGPVDTVRATPLAFDLGRIPMGRYAERAEIAATVRFLCSTAGRYITGQTIHVNGGLYMNN